MIFSGCSDSIAEHPGNVTSPEYLTNTTPTTISPISTSSTTQPAGLLPHVIGSANLAGANTEVATIKTAVNTYSSQYGVFPATSLDLIPSYVNTTRAKYYFNAEDGSINRVDSISGWTEIVFSLSTQTWIKGLPDNNHPDDQDIP